MNDNKWKIYCENNSEYEFDAVIFTIPVSQVLQLDGILSYAQGLIQFILYYYTINKFLFKYLKYDLFIIICTQTQC